MTTRFIDLASGNDSNDGLSESAQKLTVSSSSAGWTAGDLILVSGTSSTAVAHAAVAKTINNITIRQNPNGAQAIWDGARAAVTWAAAGGGVYTITPATGGPAATLGAHKLPAITCNWRASTNSRGSHYGTAQRMASAAAVATAAGLAGAAAVFFYATATGQVDAYFGGLNPNLATVDYVARDSQIALDLTGTGNIVDGIWFYRWHNDAQGACIWIKDGTGSSTIINCKSWDCGPHAFICSGQTALMANASIINCFSDGAKFNAAHFTFYQTDGFGTTSSLTASGCSVERHNWFNIDQTETLGTADNVTFASTCAQTGFYCHADTGTPTAGVLYSGCSSYDQSVVNAAIADAGNNAAPGAAGTWSTYTVRIDTCNFQNMSRWGTTSHIAARKTTFGLQRCGSSLLCAYTGLGCVFNSTAGSKLYAEACSFVFNSNGAGANGTMMICLPVANLDFRFVNCSICDLTNVATGFQLNMLVILAAGCNLAVDGSILSNATDTADTQCLSYCEVVDSTALDLNDNAYGIFSDYGLGSVSYADPLAEDGNGINLGSTVSPYNASSSGSLAIGVGSAIFTRHRVTGVVVPSGGLINGTYNTSFGAYRYGASGSGGSRAARGIGTRARRVTRV